VPNLRETFGKRRKREERIGKTQIGLFSRICVVIAGYFRTYENGNARIPYSDETPLDLSKNPFKKYLFDRFCPPEQVIFRKAVTT
jgi:hypothetical protein